MIDRLIIPLLVAGMLATGTANTLLTKLQDQVCVGNCESPDPTKRHYFEQPVIQTLQMFIGEMGCWLVVGLFYLHQQYLERKNGLKGYEPVGAGLEEAESSRGLNPAVKALVPNSEHRLHLSGRRVFLLALPACCDIAGTTLMNVGLFFVVASIYQMTRGALVLFVGIFSVIFLKRRLRAYQWLALAIVVLGVAVVGLAGALYNEPAALNPSHPPPQPCRPHHHRCPSHCRRQIFTATQFVLEEFILEKYALEPLKVVGWEGVFGFLVTTVGMFVLHFMVGWREVSQYPLVAQTSVLIMISIGCFNYFGISVTRSISATARSVIDTCRTLFIWIVSVGLGWESFKWLQVAGFILLVYGTFLFNDLINEPLRSCWLSDRAGKQREREEREENNRGLLQETPVEHI
ncbi:hypothetical protein DFH27DRAFT_596749 [Peziza echinospora]|nr:hypothetical protein DFH27DRAFT_596749 [Peziza echinospora]